ncbi:MAG: hypothetical protein GF320_03190 [Armatimonadia bacterium]|nr:hypothetical protein [Armatimonadia bacterium]
MPASAELQVRGDSAILGTGVQAASTDGPTGLPDWASGQLPSGEKTYPIYSGTLRFGDEGDPVTGTCELAISIAARWGQSHGPGGQAYVAEATPVVAGSVTLTVKTPEALKDWRKTIPLIETIKWHAPPHLSGELDVSTAIHLKLAAEGTYRAKGAAGVTMGVRVGDGLPEPSLRWIKEWEQEANLSGSLDLDLDLLLTEASVLIAGLDPIASASLTLSTKTPYLTVSAAYDDSGGTASARLGLWGAVGYKIQAGGRDVVGGDCPVFDVSLAEWSVGGAQAVQAASAAADLWPDDGSRFTGETPFRGPVMSPCPGDFVSGMQGSSKRSARREWLVGRLGKGRRQAFTDCAESQGVEWMQHAAPVAFPDGALVCVAADGAMYAARPQPTGEPNYQSIPMTRWSPPGLGILTAAPAWAPGSLLLAPTGGGLVAVTHDGEVRWSCGPDRITHRPVVHPRTGAVWVVAGASAHLLAPSATLAAGPPASQVAVDLPGGTPGHLALAGDGSLLAQHGSGVDVVSVAGEVRQLETGGPPRSRVAVGPDGAIHLVVGTILHSWSSQYAKLAGGIELRHRPEEGAGLAITRGGSVCCVAQGYLIEADVRAGSVKHSPVGVSSRRAGGMSQPVTDPAGRLYVGLEDGLFACINTSEARPRNPDREAACELAQGYPAVEWAYDPREAKGASGHDVVTGGPVLRPDGLVAFATTHGRLWMFRDGNGWDPHDAWRRGRI